MTVTNNIISKFFDNSVTKNELLSWKDDAGHNLWHLFSSGLDNKFFFSLCNKVTEEELLIKISEKNELGDTPLHTACWSNSFKVISYLLNEHNIDFNKILDTQNRNIAFIATEMDFKEIINLCFEKGVNLEQLDKNGKSLEYYAISYNNETCLNHIRNIKYSDGDEIISIDSTNNSNEILNFFQERKTQLRGQKNF